MTDKDRADKFEWGEGDVEMMGKCHLCKHDIRGEVGCKAFPDGIPFPILRGEHDHSKPYPGDNGIRFEPKEK